MEFSFRGTASLRVFFGVAVGAVGPDVVPGPRWAYLAGSPQTLLPEVTLRSAANRLRYGVALQRCPGTLAGYWAPWVGALGR